MTSSNVLIIGAGAAGLMTAYRLVQAGKKVTILEARNRIGGRIETLDESSFPGTAETGAEFVHGDLPVTLALLKETKIKALPAGGEMWTYEDGELSTDDNFIENWDLLMQRLEELEHDISINTFLDTYFAGAEYQKMRTSVIRFVSGYDNADPEKASSFALRREWQSEDDGAQHRVAGGYSTLMDHLATTIKNAGSEIYLNTPVKAIHWQEEQVRAITTDDTIHSAEKIVLCVPLGILQIPEEEDGSISFLPKIQHHTTAIHQLGFGSVVKILMLFKAPFWQDKSNKRLAGKDTSKMGYLLSEEEIPTWWTQNPRQGNLLTGWLGGETAAAHKTTADKDLLHLSLQSLSNIYGLPIEQLKNKLVQYKIANWPAEPYTRGGYAYDTVGSSAARKALLQPAGGDTIYFAGEYLYDGAAMGTVEAALSSGQDVAKVIADSR